MKKTFLFLLLIAPMIQTFAQESVDLGLSVKWATCNIGATTKEEPGAIFINGTIKPWDGQKMSIVTSKVRIYSEENRSGDPNYDAATVYWGNGWRTPTKAEFDELYKKCKWKFVKMEKDNGAKVYGFSILGPNGKSIFLPCTSLPAPFSQKSAIYQMSSFYNNGVGSYVFIFGVGFYSLNHNYKAPTTIRPVINY